jgi:hypothetical protein
MKKNIGYALVDIDQKPGEKVRVVRSDDTVEAVLTELPFM